MPPLGQAGGEGVDLLRPGCLVQSRLGVDRPV
jgi:hypothetical protein